MREEKELARQMPGLFPALGKGLSNIDTRSTFVPRAMMTMYQFNHEMMLSMILWSLRLPRAVSSPPLYFFRHRHRVRPHGGAAGNGRRYMTRFLDRHSLDRAGPTAARRQLYQQQTPSPSSHHAEIYGVIQANRASGLPAPTTAFMTVEEYRGCWLASNLLHYLRNNISPFELFGRRGGRSLVACPD